MHLNQRSHLTMMLVDNGYISEDQSEAVFDATEKITDFDRRLIWSAHYGQNKEGVLKVINRYVEKE